MAESSGKEIREMAVPTNLSLEIDRSPRDLLLGFSARSQTFREDDCTDGDGGGSEIELSLGLSMGGRFGVDKNPGKLKRSSSIVGTIPIFSEQGDSIYTAGLTRSASLPAEEWRVRRTEANKRRRFEKQMSCGGDSDGAQTVSFGFLQKFLGSSRQGSVDSDGRRGYSSSMSEMVESKNQQCVLGSSNSCGEGRSLSVITGCSSQERSSHETDQKSCVSVAKADEAEKSTMSHNLMMGRKGKGSAMGSEMPCVFTKGIGPNGRRVQGILYKYGKGEDVRIMCICHGSFLSPAEFVKHAGGEEVDHPLRHIVVSTSTIS